MTDPLKPSVPLLTLLGSIAVHVEEMLSITGHDFDRHALEGLLKTPELVAWLKEMDAMMLLPKKRYPEAH